VETSDWAWRIGLAEGPIPELRRFTLKVMRDGRSVTVDVTSDGAGLVSHAGSALVAQVAEEVGLTNALSLGLAGIKRRRRGHDPGRVVRDLAVMLVDGGGCVSDLGAVREQDALFGAVASDSTAFRMIDRIASTPGGPWTPSVTLTRVPEPGSGRCVVRPSG
jgi:Transposase DDE domain group 1